MSTPVVKRVKRSFKSQDISFAFSMSFNMFANVIMEWVFRDFVDGKCMSHLFVLPIPLTSLN